MGDFVKTAEALIETLCSEPYRNSRSNKKAVKRLTKFITEYKNEIKIRLIEYIKKNEASDI